MMLKCTCSHISISKIGNSIDENEDNILVPSPFEIENEQIIRFAISDGATESSFSKEWSELLVSCYKDLPFDIINLPSTIDLISKSWHSRINAIDLPWYAAQKAEIGAFATFLGLLLDLHQNRLEAIAIGDCTMFVIREDKLFATFPIDKIDDYGNTPHLFATNNRYQTDFLNSVFYYEEKIHFNDLIILASDALAIWIFNRIITGEKPWVNLITMLNDDSYSEFEAWAINKIKNNEIKNDDISLVIIRVE